MFRVLDYEDGTFVAEFGRYEWAKEHILEEHMTGIIHNTETGRLSLPING